MTFFIAFEVIKTNTQKKAGGKSFLFDQRNMRLSYCNPKSPSRLIYGVFIYVSSTDNLFERQKTSVIPLLSDEHPVYSWERIGIIRKDILDQLVLSLYVQLYTTTNGQTGELHMADFVLPLEQVVHGSSGSGSDILPSPKLRTTTISNVVELTYKAHYYCDSKGRRLTTMLVDQIVVNDLDIYQQLQTFEGHKIIAMVGNVSLGRAQYINTSRFRDVRIHRWEQSDGEEQQILPDNDLFSNPSNVFPLVLTKAATWSISFYNLKHSNISQPFLEVSFPWPRKTTICLEQSAGDFSMRVVFKTKSRRHTRIVESISLTARKYPESLSGFLVQASRDETACIG